MHSWCLNYARKKQIPTMNRDQLAQWGNTGAYPQNTGTYNHQTNGMHPPQYTARPPPNTGMYGPQDAGTYTPQNSGTYYPSYNGYPPTGAWPNSPQNVPMYAQPNAQYYAPPYQGQSSNGMADSRSYINIAGFTNNGSSKSGFKSLKQQGAESCLRVCAMADTAYETTNVMDQLFGSQSN